MHLDTDEALKVHIEGLQATLTKRNARIADLEARLAIPVDLPENIQKMIDKAYKDGWEACSQELMEITREAAMNLGKVHKKASKFFMKGRDDE